MASYSFYAALPQFYEALSRLHGNHGVVGYLATLRISTSSRVGHKGSRSDENVFHLLSKNGIMKHDRGK